MNIDFETFSEAGYTAEGKPSYGKGGLPVIGAINYAKHPSTRVLCLAYGRKLWLPGMAPPSEIWECDEPIEAFNAPFEWAIWEYVCHRRMGWPRIPLSRFSCTAARARAVGFPHTLEAVGEVLGSGVEKDKLGKTLIKRFSIPGAVPVQGDRLESSLYSYCLQDVAVESTVSQAIPQLSPFERRVWEMDTLINQRGVGVDIQAVRDFKEIAAYAQQQGDEAMQEITGGAAASVNSVQSLKEWAASEGVEIESMSKGAVEALLKDDNVPESVRDMLEVRLETAVSSVKKLGAIEVRECDGRLHDLYMYRGAHTGRVTGKGPQPANLPNSGPDVLHCPSCGAFFGTVLASCPNGCNSEPVKSKWCSEAAEAAIESARVLPPELFINRWGPPLRVISGSLRALFTAGPGKILTCSDYNSIEARALAMMSGEQWRIDVFRTHGLIYEASGARMFNKPLESIGKDSFERKCGKVSELALGYGGWINALIAFGADKFLTEDQLKQIASDWRNQSPMVVRLWQECHNNFCMAYQNPGMWFTYREMGWYSDGDTVIMRMPSGNFMYYRNVQLTPPKFGAKRGYLPYDISYMGWNTNQNRGKYGWTRLWTRGSRLTENAVQSVCRDIQMSGMMRLEAAGYPIVMHVYDENIAETDEDFGSISEFERIMEQTDPWGAHWPIKASGGWRGKRYRK